MKRGFTVVEVLVTMVVIAILLGLGTVGLRGSLANARDAERRSDIEAIARSLEIRYDRGNTYTFDADTDYNGSTPEVVLNRSYPAKQYPGDQEMWDYFVWGSAPQSKMLPDISEQALHSPSGERLYSFCFFSWGDQPRCDAVEKDSNIQAAFAEDSPYVEEKRNQDGYRDRYLYEFVGSGNSYCTTTDCFKYNLYWISETDRTVYKGIPGLKVLRSKHR